MSLGGRKLGKGWYGRDNARSMANHLPSAKKWTKVSCHTNGIHGAAKQRRAIKKGTNAARRNRDKQVIREAFDD